MRALVLVLFASAALAAAKPKVVVDAPAPLKALLTNALKKKFTPVAAKGQLSDAPLANEVRTAVREAGAVAVVTARFSGGQWNVMVLNGADGTVLDQFNVRPPNKKPLKALPKGVDAQLVAALAEAKAPKAKDEAPKAEPEPAKEEVKEEPKKEPPPKKETKKEQAKREAQERKDEQARVEAAKKDEAAAKEAAAKEAAAKQEVKKAETPEPAHDEAADGEKPVALRVAIGGRVFSRRFSYVDDIFGSLSKYTLAVGPALVFEADWFPGAHLTRGVAANIGILLGVNYAVGITSVATDGTRYGTSALRLNVGATYRIAIGPLELLPTVGYMMQTYSIAGSPATKPNIPDVSYSELRFGLGTRVRVIGPLSITAGFAYDLPLSTGEISSRDYFPHLKVGGLDANLGLAVGIGSHLELRAGVDYIRYWYSLNPDPADPGVALNRVAGGALDDYRGVTFTAAFVL